MGYIAAAPPSVKRKFHLACRSHPGLGKIETNGADGCYKKIASQTTSLPLIKVFSPNTHFLVFLSLFAQFYGLGDDGLGIVSWGMNCDGSP